MNATELTREAIITKFQKAKNGWMRKTADAIADTMFSKLLKPSSEWTDAERAEYQDALIDAYRDHEKSNPPKPVMTPRWEKHFKGAQEHGRGVEGISFDPFDGADYSYCHDGITMYMELGAPLVTPRDHSPDPRLSPRPVPACIMPRGKGPRVVITKNDIARLRGIRNIMARACPSRGGTRGPDFKVILTAIPGSRVDVSFNATVAGVSGMDRLDLETSGYHGTYNQRATVAMDPELLVGILETDCSMELHEEGQGKEKRTMILIRYPDGSACLSMGILG